MNNSKCVGVDMGNKNARIVVEKDGKIETLIIPNIIKEVTVSKFSKIGNLFEEEENPSILKNIQAKVTSNGRMLGEWYFGARAHEKGAADRGLDEAKYNDDKILSGILIMNGLANLDFENPNKEIDTAIGTCLPINEYVSDSYVKIFKERLVGSHIVEFTHPLFNNATIKINVKDDEAIVRSEGALALYNAATDEEGKPRGEYKTIMRNNACIVVDIGGGTVDIATIMRGEPIDDMSDSIEGGILNVLEKIRRDLQEEKGKLGIKRFDISKAELDYRIRNNQCKLITPKGDWDIKEICEKNFKAFSDDIVTTVKNLITNASSIDIVMKIKKLIITGGGGELELLGENLKQKLDDKLEEDFGITAEISENCLEDNANGGYKLIVRYMNKYKSKEVTTTK